MPFDTTYKIYSNFSKETYIVTIIGNKDTVIYCTTENIPEHLQSNIQVKEFLRHEKSVYGTDNEVFAYIGGIAIVLFGLAMLSDKIRAAYRLHYKKKVDKIIPKVKFARYFILFCFSSTLLLFLLRYFEFGMLALIFTCLAFVEFKKEFFHVQKTINHLLGNQQRAFNNAAVKNKQALLYEGRKLKFTNEVYDSILTKRFSYYNNLKDEQKEIFVLRLKRFLADKNFYFHHNEGFKEMPILVCASAIQLTFGLTKYMLPYFKNIHIYPEEFFRSNENGMCFLEGNVTGSNINLSWKHFLKGYETADGQNVGLHELAHALFFQTFEVEQRTNQNFRNLFDKFSNHGNKVHHLEKANDASLYSSYADKSFQEFWAESVEIFFEKPWQLKKTYPLLYDSLAALLNQNPCEAIPQI